VKYFHAVAHPVFGASGELDEFVGTVVDVTERKQAEEERRAQLWFFESMDGVNRAIQRTSDVEQMLGAVLDVVVAVFNCDRAWLIYPCDPEVATHRVRMERTRPEYIGAFGLGAEIPNDPEVAGAIRALVASGGPVRFDPESGHPLPSAPADRFSVRSMIAMAVYPKTDKPYMFGLHQCSQARIWTPREERLFQEIGRRLSDALDTLLVFRDLRESERKLERGRAALAASRARIVTAADEARRRIERDLHDGVQQQLVTVRLELVEIARGIHPAVLAVGGLRPALKALARRSPVPVELDLRTETRLPAPVEVAAYYVVSEALTNIAKHADASAAQVAVEARDGLLGLSIRDDGRGGADARCGSGLIGLADRVDALGGTIDVVSPIGEGTRLHVRLPIENG
jgi:signal transduction histidine kinase